MGSVLQFIASVLLLYGVYEVTKSDKAAITFGSSLFFTLWSVEYSTRQKQK